MENKNCYIILTESYHLGYCIINTCNPIDALASYLEYCGYNTQLFIKGCKDEYSLKELVDFANYFITQRDDKICGVVQASNILCVSHCQFIDSYYKKELLDWKEKQEDKTQTTTNNDHKCINCGDPIDDGMLCFYCNEND